MSGIIIGILWTIVVAIAGVGVIALVREVRRSRRESKDVLNTLGHNDSNTALTVSTSVMMTSVNANLSGGGSSGSST